MGSGSSERNRISVLLSLLLTKIDMSQTIAGALVGGALGAFGKKPEIPAWEAIDPAASQKKSITSNLQNFAEATALASKTNRFNQDELDALIERALPGGSAAIKQNIMAELNGQLPPDVVAAIQRNTAQQASAGGFSDSQFSRALTARDIGLTSLQLTQKGLDSAQRWLAQSVAPVMDVSRMFFTPQQILSFDVDQQSKKFNRDLLANQVAAAPDPDMVQIAQGFDNFFKTWSSIGTSMAGKGMGGGMGGGGDDSSDDGGDGNYGFGGVGYNKNGGGWFLGKNPGKG